MKNYIFIVVILLFPCMLFAQIPEGSILWLQGDNGVIQTGGRVSRWVDQSGKGNSVTQSNTVSQPLLVSNTLNGHSIIKFTGGFEFFVGPQVFPRSSDYTITAVIRIDDPKAVNNIISGDDHAMFCGGDLYPRVVHKDFSSGLISSVPFDTNFGLVTVRFSEVNAQAKVYVNGQSGDSLYITSNTDPAIYIGAFRSSYGLKGALAEMIVFDRQLSEAERNQMEASLRSKYGISVGKPSPIPDSTFTSLPAKLQLFPRGTNDSAVIPIEGAIYRSGYDSVYVECFRNGNLFYRSAKYLDYSDNKVTFSFEPVIHAELSEYHFIVHLLNSAKDSIIADRDSITCGDVYLITGESNAIFGNYNTTYRNEYCRTFGLNLSHNIRDTLWALSDAQLWGDGASVSGWGLMLQKRLVEEYHVPSCIINGGKSGTVVVHFLRDSINPTSLETIYGRMLYRTLKSNTARAAKALFWYHGELDFMTNYYDNFKTLYSSWLQDYPNLQKFYVMQIRPAFCVNFYNQLMRELLRTIQDSLPRIESISTTMFPNQDGCHFHDDGFAGIVDQLFPIIERDFYGSIDTTGITSPNIKKAFYTTPQNNEIAMVFTPLNSGISATNDTTVGGIFATIKDYFYPDFETGKIESIRFSGDTVFLKLYSPSNAKFLSYIPDRYYNQSDSVFYEGPWLKSSKGIGALIFFQFPIDDWKSGVKQEVNSQESNMEITSNPFKKNTLITFYIPDGGFISISIYDNLGRKIRTLIEGRKTKGAHEINFDASDLPAGQYFCRLQTGDKVITKKMVLIK